MIRYHVKILRQKFVYLALICWPLIFIPTTLASIFESKAPIKIGSYLTPGLIKEDETGMFNQLNNAIFLEIRKNSELTISSLNRARRGIKNGRLDAYFPELWENLPGKRDQYIVSRPFFYKRIILFTLISSSLTELSEFEGKLLGAVQGFSYGTQIKSNPSLKLSFQKNDIVNIKLLLNNRVAGVLGGYPGTVDAVLKSNNASKIHYDLDKPVAILESFYVCKNDSDGIKLCDSISKAIQSLVSQGVLELNEDTGYSRFNPLKLGS